MRETLVHRPCFHHALVDAGQGLLRLFQRNPLFQASIAPYSAALSLLKKHPQVGPFREIRVAREHANHGEDFAIKPQCFAERRSASTELPACPDALQKCCLPLRA